MSPQPRTHRRKQPRARKQATAATRKPAIHTPDDVVVHSSGAIIFSDGNFAPIGPLLGYNDRLPVYLLNTESAELTSLTTVSGPNGASCPQTSRCST